ncbi:MAG: hypothetical protein IPK81_21625 [Rhodospirillales bacterium]|nr:MAG: hypothetical protein IPK81_21625 [Rhodospirillales bacterium]
MTTQISPLNAALDGFFRSAIAPVFLCGADAGRVTLHVKDGAPTPRLKADAEAALRAAGLKGRVVVREHGVRDLAAPRSLERLAALFAHDSIVYDPTASIGRARALVDAAATLRRDHGKLVRGVFLDPAARILFVVMPTNEDTDALVATGKRLQEACERAVEAAAIASGSPAFNRPPIVVRAVTDLPGRELIPVDERAARLVGSSRRNVRRWLTAVAAAIGVGTAAGAATAQSASGPAVSGLNGKVELSGGYMQSENKGLDGFAGFAAGSVAAPIGHSFGVQGDVGVGIIDGEFAVGTGGHLFWRDPSVGLVGAAGQWRRIDKTDLFRVGGQGELYLNKITAGIFAGYQWGERGTKLRTKSGFVGGIDLKAYPMDDLMLRAGLGVEAGSVIGRFGAEYRPGFQALPGLSLFADGGVGPTSRPSRWPACASTSARRSRTRRSSVATARTIPTTSSRARPRSTASRARARPPRLRRRSGGADVHRHGADDLRAVVV